MTQPEILITLNDRPGLARDSHNRGRFNTLSDEFHLIHIDACLLVLVLVLVVTGHLANRVRNLGRRVVMRYKRILGDMLTALSFACSLADSLL